MSPGRTQFLKEYTVVNDQTTLGRFVFSMIDESALKSLLRVLKRSEV